jgi:asparagine synthase (glutamine-hydrolysing)
MAVASRLKNEPIQSFTVRFPSEGYDEGEVAETVARHLGTTHRVHFVRDEGFSADDFWRIVDHVGTPFLNSTAIPTSIVSRFAREHVTVCLSGDGGDEMFGGYSVFQWRNKIAPVARAPRLLLAAGEQAARMAGRAPWLGKHSELRKLRRGLEVAQLPERAWLLSMGELLGTSEVRELCRGSEALLLPPENLMTEEPPRAARWSGLRKMMAWRIRHSLEPDMLVNVDRMSMAHSLEVRAPFLDPEMAELSMRLPDHLLLRDGVGKWILRRAVRDLLPSTLFEQPKHGFSIPLHRVQNDTYLGLVDDLLLQPHPLHALFDPGALARLTSFALTHMQDNAMLSVYRASHQVWALLQLFGWVTRFGITV